MNGGLGDWSNGRALGQCWGRRRRRTVWASTSTTSPTCSPSQSPKAPPAPRPASHRAGAGHAARVRASGEGGARMGPGPAYRLSGAAWRSAACRAGRDTLTHSLASGRPQPAQARHNPPQPAASGPGPL